FRNESSVDPESSLGQTVICTPLLEGELQEYKYVMEHMMNFSVKTILSQYFIELCFASFGIPIHFGLMCLEDRYDNCGQYIEGNGQTVHLQGCNHELFGNVFPVLNVDEIDDYFARHSECRIPSGQLLKPAISPSERNQNRCDLLQNGQPIYSQPTNSHLGDQRQLWQSGSNSKRARRWKTAARALIPLSYFTDP
ncbi:hypothetical protein EG68_05361, partial [Paragonimus skrjabini miyazakii]